jgi:nucleotide-binding universal stress UspA family protein
LTLTGPKIRIIIPFILISGFLKVLRKKRVKEIRMKIKIILWPTDFSSNAAKALPYVQSLTEQYEAQVHVLYVIQDIAHDKSWYGTFAEKHIDELIKHSEKSARKHLDQICDKYMGGASLYVKHIAVGDPAQEILKFIREKGVEMVVMATHGEKGHFQFGSVCEKVMKNSPVPVIAIPILPDVAA